MDGLPSGTARLLLASHLGYPLGVAILLHWGNEYVNKNGFTTNNVENFFGTFTRGMRGTYHFCSSQHLQRYLDEFSFRYTNRSGLGIGDVARAELIAKGAEGKRLTYRRPN